MRNVVGIPAVAEDGDVVVPVEEYEFLFAEDYEEGVNEFGVFGEAEETTP